MSYWMNAAWRGIVTGVIMLGVVTAAAGCTSAASPAAGGRPTVNPAAIASATTAPPATAPPSEVPSTGALSTAPSPIAADLPTLGLEWQQGTQQGYGTVRPVTVFNGGDPTGLVRHITWSSWGGATATGRGRAEWVGPHQVTAQGTFQTATIVAFDLGDCGGHPAYQAVEWFFPQHGGKFSPATYINDCTGQYVGNR